MPSESDVNPDIFFKGEESCVCVVILDHGLWADRQAVMDSIMRASISVGKASRTYLALPKAAASLIDARLFQERGIGLFTYDQRTVEEALPARHFETATISQPQSDGSTAGRFESELRGLRIEFDMLEQAVKQLREELASVRKASASEQIVRPIASSNSLQQVHIADNLPTFFAGNPWLEVLSRRGRDETTFAG